jgi:hypothetical protein
MMAILLPICSLVDLKKQEDSVTNGKLFSKKRVTCSGRLSVG